jgi:hypothetical protein
MQTGAQRIEATLARLVSTGASAESVAAAACSIWRGVVASLSLIIGQQGVAALYKRSHQMAQAKHPGLLAVHDDITGPGDFHVLHKALSAQTSTNAAAATSAHFLAFYELLSSLIGASLTERLLGSVLDNPFTNLTAQDPSS